MAYDWQKDTLWHQHLSQVSPPPSSKKLARMKRYWYKIFVDRSFDATAPTRKLNQTELIRVAPDGTPDLLRISPYMPRFVSQRHFTRDGMFGKELRQAQMIAWLLFFCTPSWYLSGPDGLTYYTSGLIAILLGSLCNVGLPRIDIWGLEKNLDWLISLMMQNQLQLTRVLIVSYLANHHRYILWSLKLHALCQISWLASSTNFDGIKSTLPASYISLFLTKTGFADLVDKYRDRIWRLIHWHELSLFFYLAYFCIFYQEKEELQWIMFALVFLNVSFPCRLAMSVAMQDNLAMLDHYI